MKMVLVESRKMIALGTCRINVPYEVREVGDIEKQPDRYCVKKQ